MNELSLFSGAGGGLLGSKLLGWRCIGYVEIEEYCQKVLAQRIKDGFLDRAPIFGDIRGFNTNWARRYKGLVDIVTAGFPCQPFSVAGQQAGADDPRNMWPATIKCIRLVRPRYCLLENVPGLLTSGYFGTILGDLAAGGYGCRWRILSAAEVGAPHKRDRLWIIANSTRNGWPWPIRSNAQNSRLSDWPKRVQPPGTVDLRLLAFEAFEKRMGEPAVFGMDDGMANRVDRLTTVGQGQVPAVEADAWHLLNPET